MGFAQLPQPAGRRSGRPGGLRSAAGYGLLFLLGLAEGVIGAFQYSREVLGAVPVGALAFAAAIFLTCLLGGWGLRALSGGLLPAVGWFVAVFGLALPDSGGSVIIANTTPGAWFLYGGSLGALVGAAISVLAAVRA